MDETQSTTANSIETRSIEKFTHCDLLELRNDLLRSGVDTFEAALIVTEFLSGRGYGVSPDGARSVVGKVAGFACKPEVLQTELERVAKTM